MIAKAGKMKENTNLHLDHSFNNDLFQSTVDKCKRNFHSLLYVM